MIRRPPRSTQSRSSAASDVYKRQIVDQRGYVRGTCSATLRELLDNIGNEIIAADAGQCHEPGTSVERAVLAEHVHEQLSSTSHIDKRDALVHLDMRT